MYHTYIERVYRVLQRVKGTSDDDDDDEGSDFLLLWKSQKNIPRVWNRVFESLTIKCEEKEKEVEEGAHRIVKNASQTRGFQGESFIRMLNPGGRSHLKCFFARKTTFVEDASAAVASDFPTSSL